MLIFLCFLGGITLPLAYHASRWALSAHHRGGAVPRNIRTEWTIPVPAPCFEVLDPQKVYTGTEKGLLLLTYSRLVKLNDALAVEPDLLQSWTYDIDSRVFRLRLKSGLKFQDGGPVTAGDVIFSFHQWAKKGALDSDLLLPIEGVKEYQEGARPTIQGISKIDDLTVQVTLNHWVDSFIRNLSISRFVIFPERFRGISREDFLRRPIGTGPYRAIGSRRYERFEDYYLGSPYTRNIQVKCMTEAAARKAYRDGRVDNLFFYQLRNPDDLRTPDTVVVTSPNKSTDLLILSPATPELQDRALRRAIAERVSTLKKAIVDNCYKDAAVVSDSIIPPGFIGSRLDAAQPSIAAPPRSAGAKRHLRVYLSDYVANDCLLKHLGDGLKDAGITLQVSSFGAMCKLIGEKRLPAWVEDLNMKSEDPISVLQYFSDSSNEYLLGRPLPELRTLFFSLRGNSSPQERAASYRRIDDYLTSNYFVVPLFYPGNVTVHKAFVKGTDFLTNTRFEAGWHRVYVEQ